jgi:hypoxanthine phosphoribosyltransferase
VVSLEDVKSRRVLELHSARVVDERIDALAAELARALSGRAPLLVVIALGARRFAARLARGLEARGIAPELLEVRARRSHGTELREVVLDGCDASVFRGRDVVISDDIADEGRTLEVVGELVRAGAPRSVRNAVLVSKPARRRAAILLDHIGFEVESGWIVGYGMDLDGAYRDLDWLGVIEGTE